MMLDMEINEEKEDFLELEFWMNPTNLKSYKFLKDFHYTL